MPDSPPSLTPLAAAVLHVGDPERVLALECGDGEAALFLAREFPLARVRGADRSEEAVRRATGRIGLDPEGRVAFKQGTPRSLPFPDDHFDLVTAVDAAPSPAELERVLRPGGFLAIARSRGDEALRGPAGALLRRRLARRGIEPIWSEAAGAGSFSVLRLGRPGPAPASQ
ncbi:MAG TPA: class I SAM-dependent methyltransferase [Solirubrobacterales bacterium]|nr:class I SAM-dependent methyltransferase [Solirubrobacterales bacterium]